MNLKELYQELILEHGKNPRNLRKTENFNKDAKGNNPLCGDNVHVYLKLNDQRKVEDISFEGSGCAISMASASIMTDLIKGKSDNAASRIKEIMSSAQKDSIGVRVSVKSGGCAGMSYVMEYSREVNPNDELIEDKGVKVFIDSAAVMYLLGTEMDYKKEELSSSFVFNNPNETERCGCGESFKVD